MTMHLNRRNPKPVKPRSGHSNINMRPNGKYFVRIGSIDFPRVYTKEEIPEAVQFRDQWLERNGLPKAAF